MAETIDKVRAALGLDDSVTDDKIKAALDDAGLSETEVADTGGEPETVTAEVICAGVSHFTMDAVRLPNGAMRKDRQGNDMYVETRHESVMRDIIELSPFEYARLAALGAVAEPGTTSLPGDENRVAKPTPFGIPLPDEEGNLRAFEGPIMGDPAPHGPGTLDKDIVSGPRALTPEESAEFEARARGSQDPDEGGADELYDSYMELDKQELVDDAHERGLEVKRADGKEGEPLKQDYARALADRDNEEDEG